MIRIDQSKITESSAQVLIEKCPFGAITLNGRGVLQIGEGCRLCRQCLKYDISGALSLEEAVLKNDISNDWKGVCVFAEFLNGQLHPVTLELIGKARELAQENMSVSVVLPGYSVIETAKMLCGYGADTVYIYDNDSLASFEPIRFAACVADCIRRIRPAIVLFGATNVGRSLAPRLAARFCTGLTADCTALSIRDKWELVQTRPAFGGNVMAQIITKTARPQMCTVRYRVFEKLAYREANAENIVTMCMPESCCDVEVMHICGRPHEKDLSEAEAVIAVGRGCMSQKDLENAKKLAMLLGAQLGCTRPLVENGLFDAKYQIGLSGRTVKPKYLIALGISGSVQFSAGMEGTELVVAINNDSHASIFDVAHVGICCDASEMLPLIISKIESEKAMGKGREKSI